MIHFAAPIALWGVAAVAALGVGALWRGRRRMRAISSTRLWREAGAEGQTRKRRVDPVWLLVFLAGLLAACALAGPGWVSAPGPAHPRVETESAVRSLPAPGNQDPARQHVELWLKLLKSQGVAGELILRLNGADQPASTQPASLEALRQGISIPIDPQLLKPDPARLRISLRAGDSTLFERTFTRPSLADGRPFALLKRTGNAATSPASRASREGGGGGGAVEPLLIDPALERVFRIQPQARLDDPSIRPAVLLVNDPGFDVNQLPPSGPLLVIAQSATPLPGIQMTEPRRVNGGGAAGGEAGGGWVPQISDDDRLRPAPIFIWPKSVSLAPVRVGAYRPASLSLEWQTLASVDGHPWIAIRKWNRGGGGNGGGERGDEDQVTLLWFAADPAGETTWPRDPGFVVFFGELINHLWSAQNPSASRAIDWIPEPAPPAQPDSQTAATVIELNGYLGIMSIACFLTAVLWLISRSRR